VTRTTTQTSFDAGQIPRAEQDRFRRPLQEALGAGVPTIVIDVKGDLPNLLLTPPSLGPEPLLDWTGSPADSTLSPAARAEQLAAERRAELQAAGIGDRELARFVRTTSARVITPGATSGEPLHVLSSLERRSARWDDDREAAREALSAAVSLLLRLLGRDPDPAKSREHVLLSVLAERRLLAGQGADLRTLMSDLVTPPIAEVGALSVDAFLGKADRRRLAAALNALLASPTFASWREGATLDVGEWVKKKEGRTPLVVLSVAHLDDEELVLGVLLEELLSWVRTLPGSGLLEALIVFDEVYGFLPPNPANPPTKRPLVSLMKQARGFGVGMVVATQNPMDLDYRALSNAGLWCIGRLQTDADRERVLDGLAASLQNDQENAHELGRTLQRLAPRWFVVKNAQVSTEPVLLRPRQTMSLMVGPMTTTELRRAREWRRGVEGGQGERAPGDGGAVGPMGGGASECVGT
jgi:hypothetical protein